MIEQLTKQALFGTVGSAIIDACGIDWTKFLKSEIEIAPGMVVVRREESTLEA